MEKGVDAVNKRCGVIFIGLVVGAIFFCQTARSENSGHPVALLVPKDLAAEILEGPKVKLSWKKGPGDLKGAGFMIYRNEKERGESSAATFTDDQVSRGAVYSYFVRAYDKSGNVSASSKTISVTIPGPLSVGVYEGWGIYHVFNGASTSVTSSSGSQPPAAVQPSVVVTEQNGQTGTSVGSQDVTFTQSRDTSPPLHSSRKLLSL